jgi:GT2 family glycosyltransferase
VHAENRPDWTVIDRSDNRGFVRTVNQGLALCPGDAIILNSDTIPAAGWVERLLLAATVLPGAASITPWSNAATICSLFSYCAERPMPPGISIEVAQDALSDISPRLYPELPTGVGFCMLMSANARAAVGDLDAWSFPFGYGEENDWCERAAAAGFTHHLADDTFVYHESSASFGARKEALCASGAEVLRRRWPGYFDKVQRFIAGQSLYPYTMLFQAALSKRVIARHESSEDA